MFDIEKFMTTSPIEVCTANIRFHDMRTGEAFCRAIFRPGSNVSFAALSKELAFCNFSCQQSVPLEPLLPPPAQPSKTIPIPISS